MVAAAPAESSFTMSDQSVENLGAPGRRRSLPERLTRWLRYRAVIPLKRSRHPPAYMARSVSVGLFWAMTPTIGVQMAMVMLHWLAVRWRRRWDFNVVYAMAWTWVTNMFTVLPVYYVFYITGQVFLGRWDDLAGYRSFLRLWHTPFVDDPGGLDSRIDQVLVFFDVVVRGWGLAMLVGCVPYAIVAAWIGYVWSHKFVVRHRSNKLRRRLARAKRQELRRARARSNG